MSTEKTLKPIDSKATGQKIKSLMKEKNITPRQIQESLNIGTLQTVYKWISPSGKSIPSTDNLSMLAQLLDCKIDDIIVYKEGDE